jgi:uncharacterized NAD(P)/FAD-binding protein YdhS
MRVCLVGAGPRGTGVLQRLGVQAQRRGTRLNVEVVDPFPAGAGRIWRRDQSPLLWMNSPMTAVSMFDGPDGLASLTAWAGTLSDGADPELLDDVGRSRDRRFASRPVAGAYLEWAFARAVHGVDRVRVHRDRVVDLTDGDGGEQLVHLADRPEPLRVDVVVLAQGHVDTAPDPATAAVGAHARMHGLYHRPPAHASQIDEADLPPGTDVLVRGLGLTFVDLVTLLTQGRGGRFADRGDGELEYLPSGREPVLHAGSRRGVPYRSKPGPALRADPPPLPCVLTPDALPPGPLDFRRHVLPSALREMIAGHYHELRHVHPQRTTVPWTEFRDRLRDPSEAVAALVGRAIPDPAHRFDPQLLADPLAGIGTGTEALQQRVRRHVARDLWRRHDPDAGAETGAIAGIGSALTTTLELVSAGRITAGSVRRDVEGSFLPFGSYLTSGPPGRRLRELLALSRAGVVRFLGPRLQVRPDGDSFRADGPALDRPVTARHLIDARLPPDDLDRSTDPLLVALRGRGEATADPGTGRLAIREPDHRMLLRDGRVHPRRFAVGPCVAGVAPPGRGPAGIDFFEVNDRVATELLDRVPHGAG